jgi:hypothetical protein
LENANPRSRPENERFLFFFIRERWLINLWKKERVKKPAKRGAQMNFSEIVKKAVENKPSFLQRSVPQTAEGTVCVVARMTTTDKALLPRQGKPAIFPFF